VWVILQPQAQRCYIDNFKNMKPPAGANDTVYGQADSKYPAWLAFVTNPP
jgi:hypothetical protein